MKDEALRLALEVLEEMSHVNIYQNEDDEVGMKVCCDQVSYQPHSTDCQTMKAIHAIKAALEQPEPEPVAWMHKHIDDTVIAHRPADLDRHPERWMALYAEPKSCQTCEALARTVMLDQTSHDTPPKREWQGLSWEEIDECFRITPDQYLPAQIYKRIEAKLKEKNT
jgi:hypothetical protein